MSITPAYAGICAIVFIVLSTRVIAQRRDAKVSLGAGDHDGLQRAIRAHGNFAEYVPFALLLMGFAEVQGLPPWILHLLGLCLLLGRGAHAFGITRSRENFRFRVFGMSLTFGVIGIAGMANLAVALMSWF